MRRLPIPNSCFAFLLFFVLARPAWSDVLCDGVDDGLITDVSVTLGNFMTTTAGTIVTYAKQNSILSGATCYQNDPIAGDNNNYVSVGYQGDPIQSYAATLWNGSGPDCAAGGTPDTNWHSLIWVLDSGTLSLYVDGALVTTDASAGPIETVTASRPTICSNTTPSFLSGTVALVEFYDVALESTVIANKARSRLKRVQKTPATARYPLDECAVGASGHGVGFPDRSGNGRTITGDHGANTTGLTCQGSTYLTPFVGVQ